MKAFSPRLLTASSGVYHKVPGFGFSYIERISIKLPILRMFADFSFIAVSVMDRVTCFRLEISPPCRSVPIDRRIPNRAGYVTPENARCHRHADEPPWEAGALTLIQF